MHGLVDTFHWLVSHAGFPNDVIKAIRAAVSWNGYIGGGGGRTGAAVLTFFSVISHASNDHTTCMAKNEDLMIER